MTEADEPSSVAVRVTCKPCGAGQELQRSEPSGAPTRKVWTCNACPPDHYIVSLEAGCKRCPVGAMCNGSALVGALAGSVWVPDESMGVMWLQSCPAGHAVLFDDGYASFDAERQQCVECAAGAHTRRGFGAVRYQHAKQTHAWHTLRKDRTTALFLSLFHLAGTGLCFHSVSALTIE
eukprot:2384811-Rhodomonas_salina.1